MTSLHLRPALSSEKSWIENASVELGGPVVVSERQLYDLSQHPCIVAAEADAPVGFLVYREDAQYVEILAIKAERPRSGVGTRLLDHVEKLARDGGKRALRLCTTNDNLEALRFYQRRGFAVREYLVNGFEEVLRLKNMPVDTPIVGKFGITIRDVIVLERPVTAF